MKFSVLRNDVFRTPSAVDWNLVKGGLHLARVILGFHCVMLARIFFGDQFVPAFLNPEFLFQGQNVWIMES
jgi:hypothetical protein